MENPQRFLHYKGVMNSQSAMTPPQIFRYEQKTVMGSWGDELSGWVMSELKLAAEMTIFALPIDYEQRS